MILWNCIPHSRQKAECRPTSALRDAGIMFHSAFCTNMVKYNCGGNTVISQGGREQNRLSVGE